MSDEMNSAERACREDEMQTDGDGADGAGGPRVPGSTRVAPGLCAPIPDYHEDPEDLHPNPEFSYRSGHPSGRASYEYPPEGGCLPYDRHRLYGHRVLLNESKEGQAKRLNREMNYRANNKKALEEIADADSAACIERRGDADHAVMSRCGPAPNVRSQPASDSPRASAGAAADSGTPSPRGGRDADDMDAADPSLPNSISPTPATPALATPRPPTPEPAVEPLYLGPMDRPCPHCGALYFPGEIKLGRVNKYPICCQTGKVAVNADVRLPDLLKDLYWGRHPHSDHFLKNIRWYNTMFSFASFVAPQEHAATAGVFNYRVQATAYHAIGTTLHAGQGEQPRYGQLYMIDPEEAMRIRRVIGDTAEEAVVRARLTRELDDMMGTQNPFVPLYRMVGEIEREQTVAAEASGVPTPSVHLRVFCDRISNSAKILRVPGVQGVRVHSEVGAVYVDSPDVRLGYDIALRPNPQVTGTHATTYVSHLHGSLDSLTYPMLYPCGEESWKPNMPHSGAPTDARQFITIREMALYRMATRRNNHILRGGRCFCQYACDQALRQVQSQLAWLRENNPSLRMESADRLEEFIRSRDAPADDTDDEESDDERPPRPSATGTILPSSFAGGSRNVRSKQHDARALFDRYGNPDFMVTYTANPQARDVTENLLGGQDAALRPDLITRVFELTRKKLIEDLTSDQILGQVACHAWSTEFQKCGLPHCHVLLKLKETDELRVPEDWDNLVSAEIPDQCINPALFDLVVTRQMHGPCGPAFGPNAPCMRNGKCSMGYPKPLRGYTEIAPSGEVLFRRRNLRGTVHRNGREFDDSWVVPYNPTLLLKYQAHVSVEPVRGDMRAVNYIYKRFAAGGARDSASDVSTTRSVRIDGEDDEIRTHQVHRYLGSCEAMLKLYSFKRSGMSHRVVRLPVHLRGRQSVTFVEGQERDALDRNVDSELTAWFLLNETDPRARRYLYTDIPAHYKWEKAVKRWSPYAPASTIKPTFGRMRGVPLSDPETHALRLLLRHVRGARGYQDLLSSVEDDANGGAAHPAYASFVESAKARGLLRDDGGLRRAVREAVELDYPPARLRDIFSVYCAFNAPTDAALVWRDYKMHLAADYTLLLDGHDRAAQATVLSEIGRLLSKHGLSLSTLGLLTVEELAEDHHDQH